MEGGGGGGCGIWRGYRDGGGGDREDDDDWDGGGVCREVVEVVMAYPIVLVLWLV